MRLLGESKKSKLAKESKELKLSKKGKNTKKHNEIIYTNTKNVFNEFKTTVLIFIFYELIILDLFRFFPFFDTLDFFKFFRFFNSHSFTKSRTNWVASAKATSSS